MTVHIMVDLETWGTTPGCDIRSIGAVVFDPLAGTLGDEFYVATENRYWDDGGYCASGGWMQWPLHKDSSTVEWWSKQSVEAQAAFGSPIPLKSALGHFTEFWDQHGTDDDYVRFWAHGPHFDEQILAACYRAVGLPVPWHYRAPRDLRTMLEAAGMDPKTGIPEFGTEHNALDDAKAQALGVIEAFRRLRVREAA